MQSRQFACQPGSQTQGFQAMELGQGTDWVRVIGEYSSEIQPQTAKAGLGPEQSDHGLGQLEVVGAAFQCGDDGRQDDLFAVGPGGVALLDLESATGKTMDKIAQDGRRILEQRASGVFVPVLHETAGLGHDIEGSIHAGPVVHVAQVYGPGLDGTPVHAPEHVRGLLAEPVGQGDVGGRYPFDPVQDEVLVSPLQPT